MGHTVKTPVISGHLQPWGTVSLSCFSHICLFIEIFTQTETVLHYSPLSWKFKPRLALHSQLLLVQPPDAVISDRKLHTWLFTHLPVLLLAHSSDHLLTCLFVSLTVSSSDRVSLNWPQTGGPPAPSSVALGSQARAAMPALPFIFWLQQEPSSRI